MLWGVQLCRALSYNSLRIQKIPISWLVIYICTDNAKILITMDFAQLLQLSLFSQILSSSMGDHDDCVTHPYYYVSLVIATLIGALASYMFTIMYHPDPALTAASSSANYHPDEAH